MFVIHRKCTLVCGYYQTELNRRFHVGLGKLLSQTSEEIDVNRRVPTRGAFPDRNLCGCGLERGSAPDPPLGTLSTSSERPPAEEVLL